VDGFRTLPAPFRRSAGDTADLSKTVTCGRAWLWRVRLLTSGWGICRPQVKLPRYRSRRVCGRTCWGYTLLFFELDRIEHGLQTQQLDPGLFERYMQDLLLDVYPGLAPIPGGTDWGRDADIRTEDSEPATRLLATISRDYEGVRRNLVRGLRSMQKHDIPFRRVIIATPARLGGKRRGQLNDIAKEYGGTVEIYGLLFIASMLRRDGEWRSRLLGLPPGPIHFSELPPSLAESVWVDLPLVGRSDELTDLASHAGDTIVTGVPGVGKTKLVSELDGAVFVDAYAQGNELLDPLRYLQPSLLVIDDAGNIYQLVRELLRMRWGEPSLSFRLVLTCWPDEVEKLQACFPASRPPRVQTLDLLERQDMNQLLLDMGISREIARHEILTQAEGRAGWAVALGDLLLRSKDPSQLLSGQAIVGQVRKYLTRAALPEDITDLLALAAALRGITTDDLRKASEELGAGRAVLLQLLRRACTSGLVDVRKVYSGDTQLRQYKVRPPVLADALVAESVFRQDVPPFSLDTLLQRWPDRLRHVTESAINCALLDTPEARNSAASLFSLALASEDITVDKKLELARRFALLDEHSARRVLSWLQQLYAKWRGRSGSPSEIRGVLEASYRIARQHRLDGAVALLFDAAVVDKRPTNPNPEHPVRLLEDLVQDFHPDIVRSPDLRLLLAECLEDWMGSNPDMERWDVYGKALGAILSVKLEGSRHDPGDPARVNIFSGIIDSAEIRLVREKVWPPIRTRLAEAPPEVVKEAIDVIWKWRLSLSGRYVVSEEKAKTVETVATAMVRDLVPVVAGHPGLIALLRRVAHSYGVCLDISLPDEFEPFLRHIDLGEDRERAVSELSSSIAETVREWNVDDPTGVVAHLAEIQHELALTDIRWPDRIDIACRSLAQLVSNPLAWSHAALNHGLYPSAGAFLAAAMTEHEELGHERLNRLLETPEARWPVIQLVLQMEGHEKDREFVLASLTPADMGSVRLIVWRFGAGSPRIRELLTKTPNCVRSLVALTWFAEQHRKDASWSPGQLEQEWLEALKLLDPAHSSHHDERDMSALITFLASNYPEILAAWIHARFSEGIEQDDLYGSLPHPAWEQLYHLPPATKTELWKAYSKTPASRWLLLRYLVGADVEWLGQVMRDGLISPEEALSSYDGFGPDPALEDLAKKLVPRGLDPAKIAGLASAGTWWGPESHHYSNLISQFEALADSADPSVAAVGRAGVEMYEAARDAALQRERTRRIRGEL